MVLLCRVPSVRTGSRHPEVLTGPPSASTRALCPSSPAESSCLCVQLMKPLTHQQQSRQVNTSSWTSAAECHRPSEGFNTFPQICGNFPPHYPAGSQPGLQPGVQRGDPSQGEVTDGLNKQSQCLLDLSHSRAQCVWRRRPGRRNRTSDSSSQTGPARFWSSTAASSRTRTCGGEWTWCRNTAVNDSLVVDQSRKSFLSDLNPPGLYREIRTLSEPTVQLIEAPAVCQGSIWF